MSGSDDGLPMLPPWLTESDVEATDASPALARPAEPPIPAPPNPPGGGCADPATFASLPTDLPDAAPSTIRLARYAERADAYEPAAADLRDTAAADTADAGLPGDGPSFEGSPFDSSRFDSIARVQRTPLPEPEDPQSAAPENIEPEANRSTYSPEPQQLQSQESSPQQPSPSDYARPFEHASPAEYQSATAYTATAFPSPAPEPAAAQNPIAPQYPDPSTSAYTPTAFANPVRETYSSTTQFASAPQFPNTAQLPNTEQQYQQPGAPPPSLDDVPVRRAKRAPGTGWRRAVHHLSGGMVNPGMSPEERRLQELAARIRQPVNGDYRIAVLSLKGGVGKTTTTMGLGSTFAAIRGDRVIAVDANPDFGTLSQRVPQQTRSTVRDLLLDPSITSYSDVRRHTSQGSARLEVLASERDPAASESFTDDQYRQVIRILQRYYNIILTDCGTGLMHSAMAGVLELAHSLILISSSAIDGARSAAATLDWLTLHGHDHLVRNAVVVINLPRPGTPNVGIAQLRQYFLSRCRAVHIVPFDTHLAEGAEIDLPRLNKNTTRALVDLAASIADDFGCDHHFAHGRGFAEGPDFH